MPVRLRHALVTGLRAAAIAAFANAALAVVLAAGLHDVNHVHDEGTPEHVHALGEVFGPGSTAVPSAAPLVDEAPRTAVVAARVEAPTAPWPWSDCGVRDPPSPRS
jgi:hypothetical protein